MSDGKPNNDRHARGRRNAPRIGDEQSQAIESSVVGSQVSSGRTGVALNILTRSCRGVARRTDAVSRFEARHLRLVCLLRSLRRTGALRRVSGGLRGQRTSTASCRPTIRKGSTRTRVSVISAQRGIECRRRPPRSNSRRARSRKLFARSVTELCRLLRCRQPRRANPKTRRGGARRRKGRRASLVANRFRILPRHASQRVVCGRCPHKRKGKSSL